jgi:ABC-type oligopeptide transport system substrate-binding subunit
MSGLIPPGQFAAAKAKYGDKGLGVVLGTDYWGFNWEDPIVGGAKNVLLRKAINEAIDRQQLSTVIYEGTRPPTDSLLPKAMPGFRPGQGLGVARNLDQAKKDFAAWQAAGNSLKDPIRLSYNDGAGWDKVANIFVANLKEAGIDAKLDPFPADGTYFTKMRKGGGQIIRAGWFADYVTPDNFLYPLLHTKSIGGDNLERYSNPKFDALVDQARGSTSPAAANDLYAQAEKLVLSEDVVVIPTVNRASNYVFSAKVDQASVNVTPLGFVLFDKLKLKP